MSAFVNSSPKRLVRNRPHFGRSGNLGARLTADITCHREEELRRVRFSSYGRKARETKER